MQIYYTNDARNAFQKVLVFGAAGSGKTPLATTAPSPFLFVSEPGLISLSQYRLPYADASTFDKAKECIKWAAGSSEARQYATIFFDSISALSENVLTSLRKKYNNDARKYSPETAAQVMEIVFGALNLPGKHVAMTSKAIEIKSDVSVIGSGPSTVTTVECFTAVPKLGPALTYHFDNVLYLSRHVAPDGREYGALRCRFNDYAPACRNRSGKLDLWEPADISHIINKANGVI